MTSGHSEVGQIFGSNPRFPDAGEVERVRVRVGIPEDGTANLRTWVWTLSTSCLIRPRTHCSSWKSKGLSIYYLPLVTPLSTTHSLRSRYIFHLRTLSSNLHHPDAKMINMFTEGPLELDQCDLHIRGRYIAALIASPLIDEDDVFTMRDWKSGECVLVSSLPYVLFIAPTTHFPHTLFRFRH